jgi:hypothetical protein
VVQIAEVVPEPPRGIESGGEHEDGKNDDRWLPHRE